MVLALQPRLPRISVPLAIRLSRWSLPFILLLYALLVAAWSTTIAALLLLVAREPAGYTELLRRALWGMWGPDNLLARTGESAGYYAVAVANAAAGTLLPIFVLGAFVFKLFRHDPIVWRESLTIEAHPTRNYVLVVRFYNRFRPEVADVGVRAFVRWVPPSNETVYRNRPVKLLLRDTPVDALQWPLAGPGEPTSVRVLLCSTREEPEPLRPDAILVQGEWIPRESARLIIVVTGTTTGVNEDFRSARIYDLSGESSEIQEDIFQDITLGEPDQREWRNFDGAQSMYLFLYGSLMRDEDLRQEGIEPKRGVQVTLTDWRRAWNVASDPRTKNRVYVDRATRAPYDGRIASLGLERHSGGAVCGIMVPVDHRLLAAFDVREQDYDRTDVTHHITCNYGARPEGPFRVFTYVPQESAVEEFTRQRTANRLAVRRHYYDSIRNAASLVGADCVHDLEEANARLNGVRILDLDITPTPDTETA